MTFVGILISAAACILLYHWLLGHWFARVLVFLGLACLALIATAIIGHADAGLGVLVFAGGGLVAWVASGLPIYYRQYQFEQACARQRALGIRELRYPN